MEKDHKSMIPKLFLRDFFWIKTWNETTDKGGPSDSEPDQEAFKFLVENAYGTLMPGYLYWEEKQLDNFIPGGCFCCES